MKKFFTFLFCIFCITGSTFAQWSEQSSGATTIIFSVSAVNDNVVWACGEGGKVFRTVNSGITWTITASPNSSLDFHCIQGIDAMTALVGGSDADGYAYKTIDGGATWVNTFYQPGGFIDNIKQFNGFPGIYGLQGDPVGGRWTQFVSMDYGSTWDSTGFYKPSLTGEGGWNNSFFAATPSLFSWYGTNNSKLIQAFSDGTSIDRATTGLPNSYSVWGNDNNRIMTGGDSKVLYSTDQGASWTDVGAPGSGEIGGIVGGRGTSKWYYTRGNSIYYTTDDGATWSLVYTFAGHYYLHMSISPNGGCMWAVSLDGGISRYCFDMPLPVEMSSFSSNVVNNNVILKWSTVNESNNYGFEIERSLAKGWLENEWTKVGFVNGSGTTNNSSSYSFTDKNLTAGKYNYRLKQIDFNGNYNYHNLSNDVIVGLPEKISLAQNYPNPFNPSTNINFEIPHDGKVTLKIYDMMGKEVATLVNENKSAGFYSVNFNSSSVSGGLSSGVYVYRLSLESGSQNFTAEKKMLLVK